MVIIFGAFISHLMCEGSFESLSCNTDKSGTYCLNFLSGQVDIQGVVTFPHTCLVKQRIPSYYMTSTIGLFRNVCHSLATDPPQKIFTPINLLVLITSIS